MENEIRAMLLKAMRSEAQVTVFTHDGEYQGIVSRMGKDYLVLYCMRGEEDLILSSESLIKLANIESVICMISEAHLTEITSDRANLSDTNLDPEAV